MFFPNTRNEGWLLACDEQPDQVYTGLQDRQQCSDDDVFADGLLWQALLKDL